MSCPVQDGTRWIEHTRPQPREAITRLLKQNCGAAVPYSVGLHSIETAPSKSHKAQDSSSASSTPKQAVQGDCYREDVNVQGTLERVAERKAQDYQRYPPRSMILYGMNDFGSYITDGEGRIVYQSEHNARCNYLYLNEPSSFKHAVTNSKER